MSRGVGLKLLDADGVPLGVLRLPFSCGFFWLGLLFSNALPEGDALRGVFDRDLRVRCGLLVCASWLMAFAWGGAESWT